MKVLLDENLPHRLRKHLPGHETFTVEYCGWASLKNGKLIAVAEESGFEVFLTADKNMSYQQNITGRRIGIVVLSAAKWDIIEPYLRDIQVAVNQCKPGSFQSVACGNFRR